MVKRERLVFLDRGVKMSDNDRGVGNGVWMFEQPEETGFSPVAFVPGYFKDTLSVAVFVGEDGEDNDKPPSAVFDLDQLLEMLEEIRGEMARKQGQSRVGIVSPEGKVVR